MEQRANDCEADQTFFCLLSYMLYLDKTMCVLDHFSTKLLMSQLSSIINIILRVVNFWFSSGFSSIL